MQSRAEFLKSLGESLSRYEAPRVARMGCFTGLGVAALTIGAGVAGILSTDPVFPRFFRIVIFSLLGTILIVFAIYASLETGAERRARRLIREYLSASHTEMETLLEMARTRKGRFPGSEKVVEVLERVMASDGNAA
jgi:hypothetical protein